MHPPNPTTAPGRFFLAQDNDCHWYLVPANKRAEWNVWRNLDSENPTAWTPPRFAVALAGGPEQVTFENIAY